MTNEPNKTSSKSKIATTGLIFEEPVVFELGSPSRKAYSLPNCDVPEINLETLLPAHEIREPIEELPELTELDVVRHYTRLSQWNFSIDTNFYPLGSCTMKYNPKINETLARLPGFSGHHPMTPDEDSQGSLQLMYELQECLKEISGMDQVSLQPAAGAQGEFAGMLMIQAYHSANGNPRKKVLLPDSAHGTNPASAMLCGYKAVQIPSNSEGLIDIDKLEAVMDEETAAIMLTNPNTLGMFEKDILRITEIVHSKGGLVYCDGANFNAVVGKLKPGDLGIDAMHINLHKTFSTPHGGGGPGSGPVVFSKRLENFCPTPLVENDKGEYNLIESLDGKSLSNSFGRLNVFHGQMGMFVRAMSYMLSHGADGLKQVSEDAVLNANYLRASLNDRLTPAFEGYCMHEILFSDDFLKDTGVETLDFAKAMIDEGYHPMTIYFPLVIHGALLVEPTETESKQSLDHFISTLRDLVDRLKEDSDSFKAAPVFTPIRRLDETQAARKPILRWKEEPLIAV